MGTQKRGELTRSRILEAALLSFSQQGYDATGVAEICRLAGLSKGAFYHHFSSKQAVFMELLNQWLAGIDAQLDAARSGAQTTSQAFQQMAGRMEHVFHSATGQLPMFLEFLSKATRDAEVLEATNAPYRRYRDFFARMIEDGIAAGTLEPADSTVVAQVIVSLAVGLVLQSLLDPHGADWGKTAQEGVRLVLAGLETGP
jgi:AcrR family transcriptional regulator